MGICERLCVSSTCVWLRAERKTSGARCSVCVSICWPMSGAAGTNSLRAEHAFSQLVFTSFPKSNYRKVLGFEGKKLTSPGPPLERPALSFLFYLFVLSALFSQYCDASLDITQASWSCSASAESNLGARCNCQADKTFLLSFTLKRSFPPPCI